MEHDNSGVDILKLLSDFERNMADEGLTGEKTGMDEVQVIDTSDNVVFNVENYQRN